MQKNVSDSHRTRRTCPTKSMNGADGVAKFVSCDQRFELVVAWIGPPPLHGPEGAAVRPGVAGVAGKAGRVRRRSWRSFEIESICETRAWGADAR